MPAQNGRSRNRGGIGARSTDARAGRARRQNPLVSKIAGFIELTDAAAHALEGLTERRRTVRRGTELVIQRRHYSAPAVLIEGSAIRYKVFPDGRRQIVNFVLPGDMIGLRGLMSETAFNSVATLEDAIIAPFEPSRLFEIMGRFPTLGATIFWLGAIEQTIIDERLVVIGRGTAYERLGFLLLELWDRMRMVGVAEDAGFTLPLSHELLADALGLSTVHVSRTLKRLRADGLATVDHRRVELHDAAALASISDFETGYLSRINPKRLFAGWTNSN